ncbi:MAG TPA: DUF4235 domain-containing protein [Mycobacteriales bacterium]
MSSRTAKILYLPFGTAGGIAAGMVASAVFGKVWAAVRNEDSAPTPRAPDRRTSEVILAAVLRGAIFTGTRAAFDRYAAHVFARWAGEWPDDGKQPKGEQPQAERPDTA